MLAEALGVQGPHCSVRVPKCCTLSSSAPTWRTSFRRREQSRDREGCFILRRMGLRQSFRDCAGYGREASRCSLSSSSPSSPAARSLSGRYISLGAHFLSSFVQSCTRPAQRVCAVLLPKGPLFAGRTRHIEFCLHPVGPPQQRGGPVAVADSGGRRRVHNLLR